MKISQTGRLSSPLASDTMQRKLSEREERSLTSSDTQTLTQVGDLAARECLDASRFVRPMEVLKASLERAQSADPGEIAQALLRHGFVLEAWQ